MKREIFFLFFIYNSILAFSQSTLNYRTNNYRDGDHLIKYQIPYCNPGDAGENVLWDFSNLSIPNEEYNVLFNSDDKDTFSIIKTEHKTMYHYINKIDTLFINGYENQTTSMKYIRNDIQLFYPFEYNNRLISYFQGEGKYCDQLKLYTFGKTEIRADAWGTLILPGNDTLVNVLRVKSLKLTSEISIPSTVDARLNLKDTLLTNDKIEYKLANDSIVRLNENYSWYAPGFRYPIFEEFSSYILTKEKEINSFSTAFFYPPESHLYLVKDTANSKIRELASAQRPLTLQESFDPYHSLSSVDMSLSPNPVVSILNIHYCVLVPETVSIRIYSINGKIMCYSQGETNEFGSRLKQLDLSAYPKGEYVVQLITGNKIQSKKIIKK